jgi:hypothetical protein
MGRPHGTIVLTSEAATLGLTRGVLAGPLWRAPYRGVRVPSGVDPSDPAQRALEAASLLPDRAALGGWAAAYLLGASELDGRGASGRELEAVPIVVPPPAQMRPRPGLQITRSRLDPADVVEVDGVPVTSPVRTAFDMARLQPARPAVVALDILGRQLRLPLGAVSSYALRHAGWRGAPGARRVLELADARAASAGESRVRLLWMLDAGLPRPEVNAYVLRPTGEVLAVADLLDPDAGLVGEYDGAGHRGLEQHTRDNAREEWLEAAGLVVVRFTALDLQPRNLRRTVERLRVAHARGLARDRARDAWTWRPRAA